MKENKGFFSLAFDSAYVDAGLETMFHAVTNITCYAPSTLRRRELKTELYFSGWAFRPH